MPRADYDNTYKDVDPHELLPLRQLFNESQKMLHASLKALDSSEGSAGAQPLNEDERSLRRNAYANKSEMSGQMFEDELCHEHCIEDDAFQMMQQGQIFYLHPKHCPTRDQESAMEHLTNKMRRPKVAALDQLGEALEALKDAEERPEAACNTILEFGDTLRRRGGGFEVGGLLDSAVHEKIRSFLVRSLRKPSPRADMVPPSIEEVLEYDKQIWVALAGKCARDPAGLPSLPKHIPTVLDNHEIISIVNFNYGARSTPRVADAPTRAATKVRPAPKAEGGGTAGPNAERNRAKRQRKLERERNDRAELDLSVPSDQILAHLLTPTQTP